MLSKTFLILVVLFIVFYENSASGLKPSKECGPRPSKYKDCKSCSCLQFGGDPPKWFCSRCGPEGTISPEDPEPPDYNEEYEDTQVDYGTTTKDFNENTKDYYKDYYENTIKDYENTKDYNENTKDYYDDVKNYY